LGMSKLYHALFSDNLAPIPRRGGRSGRRSAKPYGLADTFVAGAGVWAFCNRPQRPAAKYSISSIKSV